MTASAPTLTRRIQRRLPARVRSSVPVRGPVRRVRAWRDERELARLVERARSLSMVFEPTLRDLALKVRDVVDAGVLGDLVECGVWRGGSAFLMAEVLELRGAGARKVWLFYSFEGPPPPQGNGGP